MRKKLFIYMMQLQQRLSALLGSDHLMSVMVVLA